MDSNQIICSEQKKSDEHISEIVKRFNAFVKIKDWSSAKRLCFELVEKYPYDYRSWISKAVLETRDYTFYLKHMHGGQGQLFEHINDREVMRCFENALQMSSGEEEKTFINQHMQKYEAIRYRVQNFYTIGKANAEVCKRYDLSSVEKVLGCTIDRIKHVRTENFVHEYSNPRIVFAYDHCVVYELFYNGEITPTSGFCYETISDELIDADIEKLFAGYEPAKIIQHFEPTNEMVEVKGNIDSMAENSSIDIKSVLVVLGIAIVVFLVLGIWI